MRYFLCDMLLLLCTVLPSFSYGRDPYARPTPNNYFVPPLHMDPSDIKHASATTELHRHPLNLATFSVLPIAEKATEYMICQYDRLLANIIFFVNMNIVKTTRLWYGNNLELLALWYYYVYYHYY